MVDSKLFVEGNGYETDVESLFDLSCNLLICSEDISTIRDEGQLLEIHVEQDKAVKVVLEKI